MNIYSVAEIVFWTGMGFLFYTYIGYGLVMYFLSLFKSKNIRKGSIRLKTTVIITAYNEEKVIENKLENVLALDYPKDCLEVLVGSDGSTDRTDSIVSSFSDKGVRLIRVEGRLGKTAVQNKCASEASGDILVFTDATTYLRSDSLSQIIENFNDPKIGCVGARLKYRNTSETGLGEGGVSYWSYETKLKKLESQVCSLIGVSGCYYAVRKSLYRDIHADLISDFVIALQTYEDGYRVIYEEKAICEEDTLDNAFDEYKMRVRVALRSYKALWEKRALLNPLKYGLFSIQLVSHKLMRYSVGIVAVLILTSNIFLLQSAFYQLSLAMQILFYLAAMVSFVLVIRKGKKGIISAPFYLVLVNMAAIKAMYMFFKGGSIKVWTPIR